MRLLLFIPLLTFTACAGPGATLPTAWARADGQPVNTGLLDIDNLDCRDEIAAGGKVDKSGYSQAAVDDFVGCMREHGYVQTKS
jgi:hypothetical protein